MSKRSRILISGAGIGGLVTAIALLQRGFDVRVFEQASQLGEIGAGFQVGANGARLLFDLELEERIRAIYSIPEGKEVRLWNTGQTWKLFDLGQTSVARYGAPYFMVHRADLHAILVDAVTSLAPDCITLDARTTRSEEHADFARLHFADGSHADGDAIIAADGVHSPLRRQLYGGDNAVYTGITAWRGVIAADRLPKHLLRPVGTNWVGPGGHIVHYFMRRGELLNFVGAVERTEWSVESWTERGSIEECAADFRGWHEDIQTIVGLIDTPYKWALLGREPMTRWSEGRVTLLGDACHPTLPFLAQGACMAMEDGIVLARCLDAENNVASAFQRYEALRLARTSRVVNGSAENGRRFHNDALAHAAGAQAYVDREWQPAKVEARYDWLFHYDAMRVPLDVSALAPT